MKFNPLSFFKKSSDKYRIAPAPESDRPQVKSHNFFQDDPSTFYVLLAGSVEAIGSKLLPLIHIPLNQFFRDEKEAFNSAKNNLKIAYSILTIKIDPNELEAKIVTLNNKKIVDIDLRDVAQSAKGFSSRDTDFGKGKIIPMKKQESLEDLIESLPGNRPRR
jgi:hypothetical protein